MNKLIYVTVFLSVLIFSAGCEDQSKIVEPQLVEANGGDNLAKRTILNEVEVVVPFAGIRFIPCANGGAGENVLETGTAELKFVEFLDGNGGFHGSFSFRALEYGGVGQVTGDIYKGVGGLERQNIYIGPNGLPYTTNFTANYNYHGPDNIYREKMRVNLVVNANGELTADFFSVSINCN